MRNAACRKAPSPAQGWIQHRRVLSAPLAEKGQSLLPWVPCTHDDGAVSRATVQLVPAMTQRGSARDSAMAHAGQGMAV